MGMSHTLVRSSVYLNDCFWHFVRWIKPCLCRRLTSPKHMSCPKPQSNLQSSFALVEFSSYLQELYCEWIVHYAIFPRQKLTGFERIIIIICCSSVFYQQCTIHVLCLQKKRFSISEGNTNIPRGFTCLQTDDTANAGYLAFSKLEPKMSKKFD